MFKKSKGFTLIELMAVLMILAIVALITTPMITKLISSSQENSYKNSIIAYGKAVENAIAVKRTQSGKTSDSIKDIEDLIKTTGNEVKCVDTIGHTGSGIALRGCQVVKDGEAKTKNTYIYINGQIELDGGEALDKNTVLAYGNALKQAIARYKEIYNKLPKTISELEKAGLIKITGKTIYLKCDDEITYNNEQPYLKNCQVFDKKYSISLEDMDFKRVDEVGDVYELSGEDYYVISSNDDYVTLLKAEPLTTDEVSKYGVGHVNLYTEENVGTPYNRQGYGGVAYYSSATCNRINYNYEGCTTDYNKSDIKYVVDKWANAKFTNNELATDQNGYQARLISESELTSLECTNDKCHMSNNPWLESIDYWTMRIGPLNNDSIWSVSGNSYGSGSEKYNSMYWQFVYDFHNVVRPVINVYKSKLFN